MLFIALKNNELQQKYAEESYKMKLARDGIILFGCLFFIYLFVCFFFFN